MGLLRAASLVDESDGRVPPEERRAVRAARKLFGSFGQLRECVRLCTSPTVHYTFACQVALLVR